MCSCSFTSLRFASVRFSFGSTLARFSIDEGKAKNIERLRLATTAVYRERSHDSDARCEDPGDTSDTKIDGKRHPHDT